MIYDPADWTEHQRLWNFIFDHWAVWEAYYYATKGDVLLPVRRETPLLDFRSSKPLLDSNMVWNTWRLGWHHSEIGRQITYPVIT